MNPKIRTIVILLALVLVLGGAWIFYQKMAGEAAAPPETAAAQAEETAAETVEETEAALSAASDFTVYNGAGEAVSLSDLQGKPVVINFWATWCPYCVDEFPLFEEAWQKYGDRAEFMMIDLTDGSRDTVLGASSFVSEKGYTFPLYFDQDFSAVEAYGVYSIPVTLCVTAEGELYASHTGAMDAATLEQFIQGLLGE